jgi:hypothetical protein
VRASLRTPALLLVALVLCACGDEARVKIGFHEHGGLTISMLRVSISDGFHRYELQPADFNSNGENQPYRSPDLPTRTKGTLRFTYALVEPSGETVSGGTVDLPLRRDWRYDIDILTDSTDPTHYCLGCGGSQPFALSPEYRLQPLDSVYVIWGGNYISHPVMY